MINIEKYLIRFSMYDSVLAKKRTGKKKNTRNKRTGKKRTRKKNALGKKRSRKKAQIQFINRS